MILGFNQGYFICNQCPAVWPPKGVTLNVRSSAFRRRRFTNPDEIALGFNENISVLSSKWHKRRLLLDELFYHPQKRMMRVLIALCGKQFVQTAGWLTIRFVLAVLLRTVL